MHSPRVANGSAGFMLTQGKGFRDFSSIVCGSKSRLQIVGAIVILTSFHLGAATCLTPPPGILGWWPGNGSAADAGGTNNGSLGGNATAAAPGLVATAFGFDGTNSFVQIPNSAQLR